MLIYLIVFHRSLRFCSFFFILFSFCFSELIISVVLPSLLPSSDEVCFWILPVKFSLQLLYFCTSEFHLVSVYNVFVLYWYSHCSYIVFLPFPTHSFISLSLFRTVLKKSFVSPMSGVLQGHFLSFDTFLFLCMFVYFFKNWTFESFNVLTLEITFSPYPRICCFFFFVFLSKLSKGVFMVGISLRWKLKVFSGDFLRLCHLLGMCGGFLNSSIYVVAF